MPDVVLPRGKKLALANGIFPYFRLHPIYDVGNAKRALEGARSKARMGDRDELNAVKAFIFRADPKYWKHIEPDKDGLGGDDDEQKKEKDAIKRKVDEGQRIVEGYKAAGDKQGCDAIQYIKLAYEKTAEGVYGRDELPKWLNKYREQLEGFLDDSTPQDIQRDAIAEYRRDYAKLFDGDPLYYGPIDYIRMVRGTYRPEAFVPDPDYDGRYRFDFNNDFHYQRLDGYPRDPNTITAYEMDEAADVTLTIIYRDTLARRRARIRVKLEEMGEKAAESPRTFSLGTAKNWKNEALAALGRNDLSGFINKRAQEESNISARDIAYYAEIMHLSNEAPKPELIRAQNIQLGELNDAFGTRILPAPEIKFFPSRVPEEDGEPAYWEWPHVRFSFFQPPGDRVWSLSTGKASGIKWGGTVGLTAVSPIAAYIFPEMALYVLAFGAAAGTGAGVTSGEFVFDALDQFGYRAREYDRTGRVFSGIALGAGLLLDKVVRTYLDFIPFSYQSPWLILIPAATTGTVVGRLMGIEYKKISYAITIGAGVAAATDVGIGIRDGISYVSSNDLFSSNDALASSDADITASINNKLQKDEQLKGMKFGVKTDYGIVEISGAVDTPAQEKTVLDDINDVSGVKKIKNYLMVLHPVQGQAVVPGTSSGAPFKPTAAPPAQKPCPPLDWNADPDTFQRQLQEREKSSCTSAIDLGSQHFAVKQTPSGERITLSFRTAAGTTIHMVSEVPTAQRPGPKTADTSAVASRAAPALAA